MKVEISNLIALVRGHDLTLYQRALAVTEWDRLCIHVNQLEKDALLISELTDNDTHSEATRPWTKEEFKKHREEWFVCKLTGVPYRVGFYLDSGVYLVGQHEQTTFEDLYNNFTRENGSPCGE